MTTHVHVMYMFRLHVHALNLLIPNTFTHISTHHVHVCAKFLKKHSQIFCIFYLTAKCNYIKKDNFYCYMVNRYTYSHFTYNLIGIVFEAPSICGCVERPPKNTISGISYWRYNMLAESSLFILRPLV